MEKETVTYVAVPNLFSYNEFAPVTHTTRTARAFTHISWFKNQHIN